MASAVAGGPLIPKNQHRFVAEVRISDLQVNQILKELGLTPSGPFETPKEGRIASNLKIPTLEKGTVMLRLYPEGCQASKLETGWVDFEVTSLEFLSSRQIRVPSPILFKSGSSLGMTPGIKYFAYPLLPGESIKQSNLNQEIAQKAGNFLRDMISVSTQFNPGGQSVPEGDTDYIFSIYRKLLEKYPELNSRNEFTQMADQIQKMESLKNLLATPKGIVHADFFFENILIDPATGTYSALDFGDAYYGHVVMDIVIGAMEFSILEDGSLNPSLLKSFLHPHAKWLQEHRISSHLFYSLLLLNCLRFSIYTLPNTLDNQIKLKDNPYISRFYYFLSPQIKKSIFEIYEGLHANDL